MEKEQRDQIIQLCKEHIEEHGSVRIGWAAEKILELKPQHNILDKIAALMLQTRKYVKEPANPNFKYDWNIRKNPEFKREKWTERNPISFELLKGFITAVFSIIVSVILSLYIVGKGDSNSPQNKNIIPTIENKAYGANYP